MSEYKKIFSQEAFKVLKQESRDSLQKLLGKTSWKKAMIDSGFLMIDILELEYSHKENLTALAVEIFKEMYPIVKDAQIEIEASIVQFEDLNIPQNDNKNLTEPQHDNDLSIHKRRIINSVTQGASMRGSFSFLMYKEHLDKIHKKLITHYKKLLNLSYGIYDSDEAVTMMLQLMSYNLGFQGGESEVVEENSGVLKIKAKATTFPILLQELIKGLYEILSLHGFSMDAEKNLEIVAQADQVIYEIEDFRYGKFIYDAIHQHYINSNIDDNRVRELFFTKVYSLNENEFFEFVENSIVRTMTLEQEEWIQETLSNVQLEIQKQDIK